MGEKIKLKFSVIIALAPSRNAEVLESLRKGDYDKSKVEIIVEKGLNPSENRNRGAGKAKGEIIAFIDDDAVVDVKLLKNAEVFFLQHPEIDLVGGPQLTPDDDGFFAKTSGFVLESYFGTSRMSCRYKKCGENLNADETFITSANCFMRRKSFLKTSGFDPGLFPGEDPEFFARVRKQGMKIAYSPALIVYHRRRNDLKGFCRQFYLYGKSRFVKESINKEKIKLVFLLPMAFVVYFVLGWILSLFSLWFLLPVGLYFLVDFIVSLWIGLQRGLHRIPLLFFLFFMLHVSYGLGMIMHFFGKRKSL